MSDPFSVAGTAVGITSLGIQVCQGLVRYYSQFRSYHDDIESAIQRLEGLHGLLKALESVKGKVELDNHAPSEQLQLAMQACEAALRQLEAQLRKCCETKLHGTLKDRANMVMKRLYWPFKKETLKDLQSALDRLQNTLQLCLQTLDVDLTHQNFEVLTSQGKELALRNDVLTAQHIDQSRALDRIESAIGNVISSYDEQTSVLTTQLAYHSTNMSVQLDSIQKSLSMLMTDTGQIRRAEQLPPTILKDAVENYQYTSATFNRSLRKYNKNQNWLQKRQSGIDLPCICSQYKEEKRWHRFGAFGRFSGTYQWKSEHFPGCPKFQHTDYVASMQARFAYCSRYLRFCISIGLSYAKLKGQSTFSPALSYRAVVPWNSPSFLAFPGSLDLFIHERNDWTRETGKNICETVLTNLIRSFRDGTARPHDRNENGDTIFHALQRACFLIGELLKYRLVDGHVASNFLGSLIDAGVPCNEKNYDLGLPLTPFDLLIKSSRGDHEAWTTICRFLIENLDVWLVNLHPRVYLLDQAFGDNMAYLLNNDDCALVYDTDRPELSPAFMQRSLPALHRHLDSGQWENRKPPPWTLAFWNEGLESYPLENVDWLNETTRGADILSTTITARNAWATGLLVSKGAQVRPSHFGRALRSFRPSDMEARRHVLTLLARELKKHELAGARSRHGVYGHMEDYNLLYVFFPDKFDDIAATALYNAGFCGFDNFLEIKGRNGTPAWIHSCSINKRKSSAALSQLLQWFEEKGADLNWIHPEFGTTPIHIFARQSANAAARPLQRYGRIDQGTEDSFWAKILLSDTRDQCSCHCSSDGCLPITVVMQQLLDHGTTSSWYAYSNTWMPLLQSKEQIQERAYHLLSRVCSRIDTQGSLQQYLHCAIIRAVTFESLHLSHTCCRYIEREVGNWFDKHYKRHAPIKRPDPDEIREIREIEGKQIDLLEYFMAQFEPKWNEHSGTFHDFIETVWSLFIKEELDIYYGSNEEEARRFKGVGVILKDDDSEDESKEGEDGAGTIVYGPERPPKHV